MLIVKADTPLAEVVKVKGDYGVIFETLLRNAGYVGDITDCDAVANQLPKVATLPQNSAILITGSKHNAWADDDWIVNLVDFIKKVIERGDIKIVGICFGSQIVARALGADMGPAKNGWEVSSCAIELTSKGREVLGISTSQPYIMQMHRDEVRQLPKDTQLLASSSSCKIQAYYRPGQLLCFQGHPEFDEFIVTKICESRFANTEMGDDAIVRASLPTTDFSKAIIKFLE